MKKYDINIKKVWETAVYDESQRFYELLTYTAFALVEDGKLSLKDHSLIWQNLKNPRFDSNGNILCRNQEFDISGKGNTKRELDIAIPFIIDYTFNTDDKYYSYFFFASIPILTGEIDAFLNYHLNNSFNGNITQFSRFLKTNIRDNQYLLNPEIITTLNEWIEIVSSDQEKELENPGQEIQEQRGDLAFSRSQISIFFFYLRQLKIINPNLRDKELAEIIHMLTGYSSHNIRTEISFKKLPINEDNIKILLNSFEKFSSILQIEINKTKKM